MSNYQSNIINVKKALSDAEQRVLAKIGMLGQAEAALRCPIDTGTLRRSITNVVNDGEKSVIIGTNVEYAPFVEKGTSRQKAQPYLEPAIMQNINKFKSIAETELGKIK